MGHDRIELIHPGNFGLYIPGGARAHMTFDAFHLGVGRIAPGGVFRLHDHMAELAAKRYRFGELIPLNRGNGDDKHEEAGRNDEKNENIPLMRVIEIYAGERGNVGVPEDTALVPHPERPDRDEDEAENQHAGEEEVGHHAEIR